MENPAVNNYYLQLIDLNKTTEIKLKLIKYYR